MKKIALGLILALLLSSNAYAECIQGDCRDGQGTYTWPDGNKYVGDFKNAKQHGQGTFAFDDGDKYVGEWKDGQRHGQGTYAFANGKIKEGIWENNKLVREKSEIVRYEKIYNKCILENLKGQSDKEVIKIIKDACKNKASNPSTFDKLFN